MCARGKWEFWSCGIGFSMANTGLHCSFDTEILGTLMGDADTSAVCSGSVNRPHGIQPA